MNEKWFTLPVEDIEKKLKTNAASGLSRQAAASRRNSKEPPFFNVKKRRWNMLISDLLADFFLVLMLIVAVFSLFFKDELFTGAAVLVLTVINLVISFLLYFHDRRCVESVSDFFIPTARVIREGKLYVADYRDVVPGDVIMIERGDILGCDARLVHSDGLSVSMKLSGKGSRLLKKYAGGAVSPNEVSVEEMPNMVHAGSVVESGSGRAIVVATGRYTYLGALNGGVMEIPSREFPEAMREYKKFFSKLGMILLLLMLPFCLFGILFAKFAGGTLSLSEALLTALALGATMMLSRLTNLLQSFFILSVKRSAWAKNPCIIRSVNTFGKLSEMDFLFLLDGSAATDGILHYDCLSTADGEVSDLSRMGKSTAVLCNLVEIYCMAVRNSPAIGISAENPFENGLREFTLRAKTDSEGLAIRCQINSYLPRVSNTEDDSVSFTDIGVRKDMFVSVSNTAVASAVEACDKVLFGGIEKQMTAEDRAKIRDRIAAYNSRGRKTAVFTVTEGLGRCFVGMLVLREGVDPFAADAVRALRQSGVRTVVFSGCTGRENAPEIPDILRGGKRAYVGDMMSKGLPVTYKFGEFDEYYGLDEKMICELVNFAKLRGKKVGVLGFSEYAMSAIEKADVFISCAPIRTGVFGGFDEEIRSVETPGSRSSASCTQEIKAEADLLLSRPIRKKGGLLPLARAIEFGRISYRNLKNFMLYLSFVQLLRIVTVIFPMLFGVRTADVRHILFLGGVFDLLVMLMFMNDRGRCTENFGGIKRFFAEPRLISIDGKNSDLLFSCLAASIAAILLPNLFGLSDAFGEYSLYRAEYTFVALLFMQAVLVFCVYGKRISKGGDLLKLMRSKYFVIIGAVSLLFTLICIFTPVGIMFGLRRFKLLFFILTPMPAAVLILCRWLIIPLIKKGMAKRNGPNNKKM